MVIRREAPRSLTQYPSGSHKPQQDYHEICGLSPVYGLALIDDIFSDDTEWYHHYRMANANDGSKSLEDIQLVLIELPKLKPSSITEKRLAILWLRFLKEINERTETVDPSLLEVDSIREALHLLEVTAYNSAELLAYDRNWDAVSSERTLVTEKYEQGKAEGLAEGKRAMILKMQQAGMPLEQIAAIADLSLEEVNLLFNE